jgi:uncharacterized protein (TIGR03437 family)
MDGIPCKLSYAGGSPGLVSDVLQINAQVPAGVSGPNVALAVTIVGVSAQTGVTLAVRMAGTPRRGTDPFFCNLLDLLFNA